MSKTKIKWDKNFYDSSASNMNLESISWKKKLALAPILGLALTVVLYLILAAIDWYDSNHPENDGPIQLIFDTSFIDHLFDTPPVEFWVVVLIFFCGFTYSIPSVWLINSYPHKGWKRLAIVISGVLTPICFIVMVANEGRYFDLEDAVIFTFFSWLIFPTIFWAICGTRSIILWVRSGFAN